MKTALWIGAIVAWLGITTLTAAWFNGAVVLLVFYGLPMVAFLVWHNWIRQPESCALSALNEPQKRKPRRSGARQQTDNTDLSD
jgi:hypothetical protein